MKHLLLLLWPAGFVRGRGFSDGDSHSWSWTLHYKADEVLKFIETALQLEKPLVQGGGLILGIIMQKSIRAQLEAAAHDRQAL